MNNHPDFITFTLKTLIIEINNLDNAIDEDINHYKKNNNIYIDLDTITDNKYPYSALTILFNRISDSHKHMLEIRDFLREYPNIALHLTENILDKFEIKDGNNYHEIFRKMLLEIGINY